MSTSSRKETVAPLTESAVRAFLTANPDFLQQNPDLLRLLSPPSRFSAEDDGAGVVDMQGFMVSRLQADLARAQDTRSEIIDTVQANLTSQKQVHDAVLAVIDARDLDEFIEIVTDRFPTILQIDYIVFCVERSGDIAMQSGRLKVLDKGEIQRLMGPERALVLSQNSVNGFLFDNADIRSDALVRLSLTGTAPPAMLALGSLMEGHFHPGQGTELLTFLTKVLESCLKRWLGLPPI